MKELWFRATSTPGCVTLGKRIALSETMTSERVAPPRASGPYTCDYTAVSPSYIAAASASSMAMVMIPWPPEPERRKRYFSMSYSFTRLMIAS